MLHNLVKSPIVKLCGGRRNLMKYQSYIALAQTRNFEIIVAITHDKTFMIIQYYTCNVYALCNTVQWQGKFPCKLQSMLLRLAITHSQFQWKSIS